MVFLLAARPLVVRNNIFILKSKISFDEKNIVKLQCAENQNTNIIVVDEDTEVNFGDDGDERETTITETPTTTIPTTTLLTTTLPTTSTSLTTTREGSPTTITDESTITSAEPTTTLEPSTPTSTGTPDTTTRKDDDDGGLNNSAKAGLIAFFTLSILSGIALFVYCKWCRGRTQNSYGTLGNRWARGYESERSRASGDVPDFNNLNLEFRASGRSQGSGNADADNARVESFQMEATAAEEANPYQHSDHVQVGDIVDVAGGDRDQPATLVDVSGVTSFENILRQSSHQPPSTGAAVNDSIM